MGLGKLDPGGGLAGRFSTTSSSRRQCWWWGRIWFISLTDSFYKLCQLSALSASILRLPEQTKTGATEAFSGLQTARADRNWCHSGERRLAAGLARGGISNPSRLLEEKRGEKSKGKKEKVTNCWNSKPVYRFKDPLRLIIEPPENVVSNAGPANDLKKIQSAIYRVVFCTGPP